MHTSTPGLGGRADVLISLYGPGYIWYILCPGPGQVTGLCGEEAGKEEVLCLGPYEVNEPLLVNGHEASLS